MQYNLIPKPACYPFRMILFVTGILEQPDSETLVDNTMICHSDKNYVTQTQISRESHWLSLKLVHLEADAKSHNWSMFCIQKCKNMGC